MPIKTIDRFSQLDKNELAILSDGQTIRDCTNCEHDIDGSFKRRRALVNVNLKEVLGTENEYGDDNTVKDFVYFYSEGYTIRGMAAAMATLDVATQETINYKLLYDHNLSTAGMTPYAINYDAANIDTAQLYQEPNNIDIVYYGDVWYLETFLQQYENSTDAAITPLLTTDGGCYGLVAQYFCDDSFNLPIVRAVRAKRYVANDDQTDVFFDGIYLHIGCQPNEPLQDGVPVNDHVFSAAHVNWDNAHFITDFINKHPGQSVADSLSFIADNKGVVPKLCDDVCVAGSRLFAAIHDGNMSPALVDPQYPKDDTKGRILFSVLNDYGSFTNDGQLLDSGFLPDVTARVGTNKRLLSINNVLFIGGSKGIDVWFVDPDPNQMKLVNTYKLAMYAGDDWCEFANGVMLAGRSGIFVFTKSLTSDDYSFIRIGEALGVVLEQLKQSRLVKCSYISSENSVYIAFAHQFVEQVQNNKARMPDNGWSLLIGRFAQGDIKWSTHEFKGMMPSNIFEHDSVVYMQCGNVLMKLSEVEGYDQYFNVEEGVRKVRTARLPFDAELKTPFYPCGNANNLKNIEYFTVSHRGTIDVDVAYSVDFIDDTVKMDCSLSTPEVNAISWSRTQSQVGLNATTQAPSFIFKLSSLQSRVYGLSFAFRNLGDRGKTI